MIYNRFEYSECAYDCAQEMAERIENIFARQPRVCVCAGRFCSAHILI